MFMVPIALLTPRIRKVLDHKMHRHPTKTYNSEMVAIKFEKIFPFLKTYGYYFRLCLFPYKLGLYHQFLYGQGTNQTDNKKAYYLDWDFRFGVAVIVLTMVMCIFFWGPVAWGLLWFGVNIAMWNNFMTIQQQIAERYCYLPNVGLMFALANVILMAKRLF